MAGGISIHAVDVASGRPAQGLRVEIWRIDPEQVRIADGRLGANGVLDHPVARGEGVLAGEYEALFHLGEFFGDSDGFLTLTPFRFRIFPSAAEIHALGLFAVSRCLINA